MTHPGPQTAPAGAPQPVAANLAAVQRRISAAARAAGREPAEVTLIAITKTHPAGLIRAALAVGHRAFGENRVQEAAAKWPALKHEYADVELHISPRVAMFHADLGQALLGTGDIAEAATALREAAALRPDHAAAHFHLGKTLVAAGHAADAVESFRAVVRLEPDNPAHLANLANALRLAGRLDEAADVYRQALDDDPENAEWRGALGSVLHLLSATDEALVCYRGALDLNPDFAEAHINIDDILRDQGETDEALRHCAAARALDPNDEAAVAQEASAYERMGDIGRAQALVMPLINAGSETPRTVLAFANLAHRLGRSDEAVSLLRRCLKSPDSSAQQRQLVHFALGGLCDSAGDTDEAFHHYSAANRLNPRRFDPVRHEAYVDSLIDAFSATALRRLPRAISASTLPVFIVGMPRSGTTLVEQILATHPDVFGAGELPDMQALPTLIAKILGAGGAYPGSMTELTESAADRAAGHYLKRLRAIGGGAERVIDKMPWNFQYLGLIALLFPKARVIHCVRDAVDTCLSCYFQNFGVRHAYSADLTHLAGCFVQYRRLMRHWRTTLDLAILDVAYEDLVRDQADTTRQMLDFCGLEWDPRCLRFHDSARFIQTASYDQVRQPIYDTSIRRSRRYRAHLAPLLAVRGEAGELPPDLAP